MAEEEDVKEKIVKIDKSQEDDDEDCYEIDCYEIETINFNRKFSSKNDGDDHDDDYEDAVLVSAKGPVALRDFPHPRHLCANFPYDATSHESYCSMCFCYVCDVAAPCLQWEGASGHCNISNKL